MSDGYMRLALRLAAKGNPSPNPHVGAVIVKDGKVIGKGYHKKAGMAHAEAEALKSLPDIADARGATMYVTLEPCNHYGRTPPCTKAIIEAGIGKVVFAMKDPNQKVQGGGEDELKTHGISVARGTADEEAGARAVNEVFIKYSTTGMPFVVLKAAMSMDGKIATRSGDSKWITGDAARKYAHTLRSGYDAVLVGINTVLKDDPQLTARIRGGRNPVRIVLDDGLKIPVNAKVLADQNAIIATCEECDLGKKSLIEAKGAKVILCGKGRVDPAGLLRKLGAQGITSILVEGGSEVHGSFVDARLVDKFVLFYAPKMIGGRDAKCAVGGMGAEKMDGALLLKGAKMRKIGEDFLLEAYPA